MSMTGRSILGMTLYVVWRKMPYYVLAVQLDAMTQWHFEEVQAAQQPTDLLDLISCRIVRMPVSDTS